jgi:mono/diheme cytochrome c family protein
MLASLLTFTLTVIACSQDQHMTEDHEMTGPHMMSPGQMEGYQMSQEVTEGEKIFFNNCARCHPQGGNNINPNLALRGSKKLQDFNTFLGFIRNPKRPDGSKGVMPSFSESSISDQQTKELYNYITSPQRGNFL